jgi:hypothetical protein
MHAPDAWTAEIGLTDALILSGDHVITVLDDSLSDWKRHAKLIAAAPELLAALAWLLEDLQLHAPKLGPLRSIAAAQALRESLL